MDSLHLAGPELTSNTRRFKELVEILCAHLKSAGIHAVPYSNPSVQYFGALSLDRQAQLIMALDIQRAVFAAHLLEYKNLNDSLRLTFDFLRAMNWTTDSGLVSLAESDDHIVVYSRANHPVFISPDHFHYTSYTLEDFYCRHPLDLFRRPETIERILIKRLMLISQGQKPQIISNADIPPHTIEEAHSTQKRQGLVHSKVYASVFKGSEYLGYLSVNRGLPVGHKTVPQPARNY